MGGNPSILAPKPNTVSVSSYIDVLQDFSFEKTLSDSRFLKSILCTHKGNSVLVKLLVKPETPMALDHWERVLKEYRAKLQHVSGAVCYSKFVASERAVYLFRQYLHNNLSDRLSTRPFLEPLEKKWITFQALQVLHKVHAAGLVHGDIKSENFVLTTWNQLFLTDFAPYKPAHLPEDNPGQFFFYFDTSLRRNCYLAPERFEKVSMVPFEESRTRSVTPQMDLFSLGCVIAELYLEGGSIFTLSQLFRYRNGDYVPDLSSVTDKTVVEIIMSLVSLRPESRHSAQHYLEKYRGSYFPEFFYTADVFCDAANASRSDPTKLRWNLCDYRIEQMCKQYSESLEPQLVSLELPFVLATARNTATSTSRIKAMTLITKMCGQIDQDDTKLNRAIPFLVSMFEDESIDVRVAALKSCAQLVTSVSHVALENRAFFSQYLLPKIQHYLTRDYCTDREKMVFATILPQLAAKMVRFDTSVLKMIDTFTILALTGDENTKAALLENIHVLGAVLGPEKTNDLVLSHVITYLNHKSSAVRLAFVKCVPSLSVLVGPTSVELFVLPLLFQSLVDPDEIIVVEALANFTSLVKLSILKKRHIWDLMSSCTVLLLHPNEWIRHAVLTVVIEVCQKLSSADVFCTLYPMIRPYLEYEVTDFSWESLHDAVKPALPRSSYVLAITWCQRCASSMKSSFWKNFGTNSSTSSSTTFSAFNAVANGNVQLTAEDNAWVRRLYASGLAESDLWKVYVLRNYCRKIAQSRGTYHEPVQNDKSEFQKLGVFPRNVFLSISYQPEILNDTSTGDGNALSKANAETAKISSTVVTSTVNTGSGGGLVFNAISNNAANTALQSDVVSTISVSSAASGSGAPGFLPAKAQPSTLFSGETAYAVLVSDHNNSNGNNITYKPKIVHSYTGNNENILRFLEKHDFNTGMESFPEFGPIVAPITNTVTSLDSNKLSGVLVAHLHEHEGSITCLASSADSSFFVSGSSDGTVKVWDALRLERNVTSKSVGSYNLRAKVLSMTFLGSRDCIAVTTQSTLQASARSSVTVLKILSTGDSSKSKKLIPVRSHVFGSSEFGVDLNFVEPVLLIATSSSKIIGLDLRDTSVKFSMNNPVNFGVPVTFCVNSKKTWCLVGTNKGYLTLWDLRLHILLKSWKVSVNGNASSISKLSSAFNTQKHGFFTLECDDFGLGIFEMKNGKIEQVCNVSSFENGNHTGKILFTEVNPNEKPHSGELLDSLFDDLQDSEKNGPEADSGQYNKITSFSEFKVATGQHKRQLYLFGAKYGTNEIVFYDILKRSSRLVCGNAQKNGNDKKSKSRASLISSEQQRAIRCHFAEIGSMCLLKRPYFMVVSGDENGIINVYK